MTPQRARIGGGLAAVIAACAVCCAGPLVAGLGSLGVASAVGAFWIPMLLILGVVALVAALMIRHRRTTSCRSTSRVTAVVDLQTPTVHCVHR